MSTPTVPIADPRTDDVRAYIGAVRAWLADLPLEDVEDLTLGMEADLAERAAEADAKLGDLLGGPEAYAAELRAAAGLPPRAVAMAAEISTGFWTRSIADARREAALRVEQWPWLRDLHPVWWVLRGAVLGYAIVAVLGTGRTVLVPVLAAAVSFWLGRRLSRGPQGDGARVGLFLVNVLAALLLLPATESFLGAGDGSATESYSPAGLSLDGGPVGNLYVYDSRGERVQGARVFTPDGRGVFLDPTAAGIFSELPMRADGTPDIATDVFPLVIGDRDPWADPEQSWTPPLTLPPVPVIPSPVPWPVPSVASSPTPTSAPSPSSPPSAAVPSPPPTPTPTSTPTPSVG